MLLQTNEKQFEFWKMRRSGVPNIRIADLFGISRQAVSRGLQLMDAKVGSTLEEMAHANQIEIQSVDRERGLLLGRSIPFKTTAIIFVSAQHGVQVWYEHEGNCGTCSRYTQCIELIWDYATELGIRIEKTADPTKMAEELFAKIKVS